MPKREKYPRPSERAAVLAALRNVKMTRSPHRYVRGSTKLFYEWLERTDRAKLPEGPPIWICGDCHAGNIGPVASATGRIRMQIRDLDQTVIGNPAHDLLRLALSLASAARGSNLPGNVTTRMLESIIVGYEQAFDHDFREEEELPLPKSVEAAVAQSRAANWVSLSKERLGRRKPIVPLGRKYWPLTAEERRAVKGLFQDGQLHQLATALRDRDNSAKVDFLDAAYWVKGCSSLGLLRYTIILSVRGDNKTDISDYCMMDIKEATKAVAPRYPKAKIPRDNARRVLEGARHLSPALGNRMQATTFMKRPAFVRELLPQDLKLEIENLSEKQAIKAAHYLAAVVGNAHSRQMDTQTRKSWLAELQRNRTQTLDAPNWLWLGVVDLLGEHERAYLHHCRRYVLESEAQR